MVGGYDGDLKRRFCDTSFGPARAYQAKADRLKPWLDDNSDRVSSFAAREIQSLERQVASETRRAQEEIALRRLDYGEPLDREDDDEDANDANAN